MTDLPHLRLDNTAQRVGYTYAGGGRSGGFALPPRQRIQHATQLLAAFRAAETEANRRAQAAPGSLEGTILAIRSEEAFELKLDSLERVQSGIVLLSAGKQGDVTVANVFVPRGKGPRLLKLIEAYASQTTPTGRPKNQELIESIASIRLATLRDFWQDSPELFPRVGDAIWWEIWLRVGGENPLDVHSAFAATASGLGFRISQNFVTFPERVVTHAYGTVDALGRSVDALNRIAELRKAKQLATDYVSLAASDQGDLIAELLDRLVPPSEQAPAVCVLDTGVNREHPMLAIALLPADTQSIDESAWGTADDDRQHGTETAGIALYGSVIAALTSNGPVALRTRLESVKILPPPPHQNDERDYGPFTIQAVALAEIQAPSRKRAVSMAVTADDRDLGFPSLWSASIDQLCSGALDDGQRLFLVSAGNIRDLSSPGYQYHRSNTEEGGIEDPGQAWNALTIGAFTELVRVEDPTFQGWTPIASSGDLCPTSRTSAAWSEESKSLWPLKPDIVLEGGNYLERGAERSDCPDLSLLTTCLPRNRSALFDVTRDTSPATAAAARMAAILWSHYPTLQAETVRGLLVHSAAWTEAMTSRYPSDSKAAVHARLRCYGYGVPDLSKALWSAENAATLIFEGALQPFKKVDSAIESNEMHVHNLPWPTTALQDLGEVDVKMKVTLSYFIEPSPGRIGWTRKHRYQSHGLRFDVIRPTEDATSFAKRLSREEWDNPKKRPNNTEETRNWAVGSFRRGLGSIHSDWWTGTAAELASCNQIAVFPVSGWWRERPHLGRWNRPAKYSLIVTIETASQTADLYTPIMNQTSVLTELNAESAE